MRTGPIRFGIVGSGWRAEFFVRLARALPERLAVAGVVTRSAERVAQLKAEWGVPAFRTVSELCAAEPEFVIPSVPWEITPQVVQELVEHEVPVLAETPLRPTYAAFGTCGMPWEARNAPGAADSSRSRNSTP
ncbi:Gfo/Idh/MocA family oxidoreductase [Streptomyces kaempferi]